MDAISVEIRLDPTVDAVEFEPHDWVLDPDHPILHHRLSHALFCIVIPAEVGHGPISIFDVVARLTHVCDGHPIPQPAETAALGRAAIVVYLRAIGAWPGTVEQLDDDIPF